MPSTVTRIETNSSKDNLTIYSKIKNPLAVSAYFFYYSNGYGSGFYAPVQNSTFYIPKGTKEKYIRSDFAKYSVIYDYHYNFTRPCNNIFIEYYDVDSIICREKIMLYKGECDTINPQILPDANLVSWINYSSSNSNIVSVDKNGAIYGLDFGESVITVTPKLLIEDLETKTASCLVKVIQHPEGVTVDSTFDIHVGESKQLIARTLPLNTTDDNITFTCNDSTIAKVSMNGKVTGVSRGSCVITATSVDGGYTAQCKVTVSLPVDGVVLEMHGLSLNVGDSEQLYANVLPVNADNKQLIWTTTDSEIAEVDAYGNVMAKKCGVAFVKATSVDNPLATDSCKVTVLQPVTGIVLNQNICELHYIGETMQLVATVLPSDASNKEVRWVSTNESVCVVSNGSVVAVGHGTCVIIATTVDGNHIATCNVSVVNNSSLHGDVNNDGKVNIGDVADVIDLLLGVGTTSVDEYPNADVDGDGSITIADAAEILDILLNN